MGFEILGIASSEVVKAAKKGEVSRYLVCGTDVYVSEESAKQESRSYDRDKSLHVRDSGGLHFTRDTYYLSSRYFQVIDLLDQDAYMPASDLSELRGYLPLGIQAISLLHENLVESSDVDTAFVLTPLSHEEFANLTALLRLKD